MGMATAHSLLVLFEAFVFALSASLLGLVEALLLGVVSLPVLELPVLVVPLVPPVFEDESLLVLPLESLLLPLLSVQHSAPSFAQVVQGVLIGLATNDRLQKTGTPPLLPIPHVFARQHSFPSFIHVEHEVAAAFAIKLLLQVTAPAFPPVLSPHVCTVQHSVLSSKHDEHPVLLAFAIKPLPQVTAPPLLPVLSPQVFTRRAVSVQTVDDEQATHTI
jgi:hypothetical protein